MRNAPLASVVADRTEPWPDVAFTIAPEIGAPASLVTVPVNTPLV